MPNYAHKSKKSFDRMERSVKQSEGQRIRKSPLGGERIAQRIAEGYLLEDLERGGNAAFGFWNPHTEQATNEPSPRVYDKGKDGGKIADGVTVPAGTAISAYSDGPLWILISFDCSKAV